MADTQLAYPDLAIDKFFGTDLDHVAESFAQLIEQQNQLCSWRRTWRCWSTGTQYFQEESAVFLFYSEDQPLSGTRTTLPTQHPGRLFGQISSLDFQTNETSFDTEWK